VITEPGDRGAGPVAGHGRLRASHADRERVVEVLKAAFVQGRLDQGELDGRVGQALASRTYAELAALTVDIPADPAPRQPARVQNGASRSHPVRNGAIGVGVSLTVAAAAVLGAFILNDQASNMLLTLAAMLVIVAVPLIVVATVAIVVDQRRSRGQLPPRPAQGGRVLDGQRDGAVGRDPARPGDRPDRTRADLRAHRSRARRTMRPVPDAV
jgi:hypothetical protein